jgi:membrane-associated protease RseP (regulator of RpoE activity)
VLALLPLLGLVAFPVLNAAIVLLTRWGAAHWLGLQGVRFLPFRPEQAARPRVGPTAMAWMAGAGLACAYLVCAVLSTVAWKSSGIVEDVPLERRATVVVVVRGFAAEDAGMRDGDRVLSIGDQPVASWTEMAEAIRAKAGRVVDVTVERDGSPRVLSVHVSERGVIGVQATVVRRELTLPEAAVRGWLQPPYTIVGVARGLFRFLVGSHEAELGGPAAIVGSVRGPRDEVAETLHRLAVADALYGLPCAFFLALVLAATTRGSRD